MGDRKVWLITGCSSGLGKGIARAALQQGDIVVTTARKAEALAGFTNEFPDSACVYQLDITNQDDINSVAHFVQKRYGCIDVLVNNAGHGYRSAVEEGDEHEVDELFQTNFFGPVRLIKAFLPMMRDQHSGTIVNVSSIGAVASGLGSSYYSASKAALEHLSEGLSAEVKPLGIRVLIVEPGAMRTNFFDSSMNGSRTPLADYNPILSGRRKGDSVDYRQIHGDPQRAGETIVKAVNLKKMPKRLLLGSDAVDLVRKVLTKRIAELENYKSLSILSDQQREQS